MDVIAFPVAFKALTGYAPFPWQEALYARFAAGEIPPSCNLPTGLGKTSVIPIWMIALANTPQTVPRRLAYVVNRRTVVDQATNEGEMFRKRLLDPGYEAPGPEDIMFRSLVADGLRRLTAFPDKADYDPLAISTLRGQFADNGEWRADPARPAIVVGTVDMVGSRLLFSGYGVGFKGKPLHAGFLGQDVLLVHDEAHLEPAFQRLIEEIREEQKKEPAPLGDGLRLRVMALSATPQGTTETFELTPAEKSLPERLPDELSEPVHFVWQRLKAKKGIAFHLPEDEREKVADRIGKLANSYSTCGDAILVYVSSLEDHGIVCKALSGHKVQMLTGTLRGLERDQMADPRKETGCPIFARFLKPPKAQAWEREPWKITPTPGTVYLVCTSAGEVGIDISADHMVCDLAPFERMAQRFGRVNRYGTGDAKIDVVYEAAPDKKKEKTPLDQARWKTLELLNNLPPEGERRSASPLALMHLRKRDDLRSNFDGAFTPLPIILPVSDILFDTWALTTIRDKLPGRSPVEPYLHGIEDDKQAETYVAWRDDVWMLRDAALTDDRITDLLDDYPLKPHELLRDSTYRKNTGVRDQLARLKDLAEQPETLPVWVQEPGGDVHATSLEELPDLPLAGRRVMLPPRAGGLVISNGLSRGLLNGASGYEPAHHSLYDVADVLRDSEGHPIRLRQRTTGITEPPKGMRRVEALRLRPEPEEGDEASSEENDREGTTFTHLQFFTNMKSADDDRSKTSREGVSLDVHMKDVTAHTERIVQALSLPDDLRHAFKLAAIFHDHGKKRVTWQKSIGNPTPTNWLAKSGGKMKPVELSDYRHEFGSMLDLQTIAGPVLVGLDVNYQHGFGSLLEVQGQTEFLELDEDQKDLVLHLIAAHHGRGRPHFPPHESFDYDPKGKDLGMIAAEVPQRFARLQRKYGRWGLAYLESLLRAADYAASANPSATLEDAR
ncbi:MAG: type I-U CRISPR-associated helicase/endonuclease Cas3 [Isosphaeraceae bacterium]|jgi:CRISPR-associated endonuclease/helicase Cas3